MLAPVRERVFRVIFTFAECSKAVEEILQIRAYKRVEKIIRCGQNIFTAPLFARFIPHPSAARREMKERKFLGLPRESASATLSEREVSICGDDCRNFEPKYGLTFSYLDKIIPKLRAMHKEHPEWFEVPRLKLTRSKNEVDYPL